MKEKVCQWNARYAASTASPAPCEVLAQHGYLLPRQGLALDLACGMAANAFFMAERGLSVDAVDISPVAIDAVRQKAHLENLSVNAIVRDVESKGLPEQRYDVIAVSHFLNRDLMPQILDHLSSSGLLFYQTWSVQKAPDIGPNNPDYLLAKGELLEICRGMDILFYQEEGLVGDRSRGLRNQAGIIALRQAVC